MPRSEPAVRFSAEDYASLVALASAGTKVLFGLQREALARAQLP